MTGREYMAEELRRLGISFSASSLQTLHSWLRKHSLTWTVPKLVFVQGTYRTDSVVLRAFHESLEGNFGRLFTCERTGKTTEDVFLKVAKRKEQSASLHMEGVLQSLARGCLRAYGFGYAIPPVYDILDHPEYGICLTFGKTPHACLLQDYFHKHLQWGLQTADNDRLLLTILAQLAMYLWILESDLGMNHRDVTGLNLLMVAPCDPERHTITREGIGWTLTLHHKAVLIDFGFACVGENGRTRAHAGAWGHNEFCPKVGRDLFLFLGSLWSNPGLRACFTPVIHSLLYHWLQTPTRNWASWLEKTVNPLVSQIYMMTDKVEFSNERTSPLKMLQDIARENPEILRKI